MKNLLTEWQGMTDVYFIAGSLIIGFIIVTIIQLMTLIYQSFKTWKERNFK